MKRLAALLLSLLLLLPLTACTTEAPEATQPKALSDMTDEELIAWAQKNDVFLYTGSTWEDTVDILRSAIETFDANPNDTSYLALSFSEHAYFYASVQAAYWAYTGLPCAHALSDGELKEFLIRYDIPVPGGMACYGQWKYAIRHTLYAAQFQARNSLSSDDPEVRKMQLWLEAAAGYYVQGEDIPCTMRSGVPSLEEAADLSYMTLRALLYGLGKAEVAAVWGEFAGVSPVTGEAYWQVGSYQIYPIYVQDGFGREVIDDLGILFG